MLGVLTTYEIKGTVYAAYISGNTKEDILSKAKSRNLNERIESRICDITPIPDYKSLSISEFHRALPEILHTACYLSFIAIKARTIEAEEVLNDKGIVHEIAHLISGSTSVTADQLKNIRESFNELYLLAVGVS